MFDRLPAASDARKLILSEIEERRAERRTALVERLSSELRHQINARNFAHTFHAKADLWDNLDQAGTELTEIGRELEKLGYCTVININRDGSSSGYGRSVPSHSIKINW